MARAVAQTPAIAALYRPVTVMFTGRSIVFLEYVSKIPESTISGGATPFLRHKARLGASVKPSGLFLELAKNPLELEDFPS